MAAARHRGVMPRRVIDEFGGEPAERHRAGFRGLELIFECWFAQRMAIVGGWKLHDGTFLRHSGLS